MQRTDNRVPVVNEGHTCANCRHLHRLVVAVNQALNQCRRFPPTVSFALVKDHKGNPQFITNGHYPVIGDPTVLWCGEHKPFS